MRKDLDEALVRDFPNLYRNRNASPSTTCMCWGFPGDGWEPLIRALSEKLEKIIVEQVEDKDIITIVNMRDYYFLDEDLEKHLQRYKHIRKDPTWNEENKTYELNENPRYGVCASQVKEKFGTLRFYMTRELPDMSKLIAEAEKQSTVTCETCGQPGGIREGGWVTVACDEHSKGKPLWTPSNDD